MMLSNMQISIILAIILNISLFFEMKKRTGEYRIIVVLNIVVLIRIIFVLAGK